MPFHVFATLILTVILAAGLTIAATVWIGLPIAALGPGALIVALLLRARQVRR